MKSLLGFLRSFLAATKADLDHLEKRIMSQITELATVIQNNQTRVATALIEIRADIATLNERIIALDESVGKITPEDQFALSEIRDLAASLATDSEAVARIVPAPVA